MYKWNYRIRYSECDPMGRLGMAGVLALFQDVGYRHAEEAGRGIAFTERTGLTYYLLSWQIRILSSPAVGEEVVLLTWFSSERSSLAEKSIRMERADGTVLAEGVTRWVLMDVRGGLPALAPEALWQHEEHFPALSFPRLRLTLPKAEPEAPLRVRYRDTDTNRHVNNVRFVHLAAEAAKVELDDSISLSVEYRRQAREGELLVPRIVRSEGKTLVSLEGESGVSAVFLFCKAEN